MPMNRAMSSCLAPSAAMDFTWRRCSSVGFSFGLGMLSHLRDRASLRSDLVEGAAVPVKNRGLACQDLPPPDNDIHISWIDVEAVTNALRQVGGDQRRAGTEEGIVQDIAANAVIQDRPAHQFYRLLRTVPGCGFVARATERIQIRNMPKCRLRSVAIPARGLAFTHGVPARLMLPVVVAAAQRKVLLCPNDLRADAKAGGFQSGRDLRGVNSGMPYVRHITGKEPVSG